MKKLIAAFSLILCFAFAGEAYAQEAPDKNSITTVKEYKYVLKETLPRFAVPQTINGTPKKRSWFSH